MISSCSGTAGGFGFIAHYLQFYSTLKVQCVISKSVSKHIIITEFQRDHGERAICNFALQLCLQCLWLVVQYLQYLELLKVQSVIWKSVSRPITIILFQTYKHLIVWLLFVFFWPRNETEIA